MAFIIDDIIVSFGIHLGFYQSARSTLQGILHLEGITGKDMKKTNYWDRLELIIESLVSENIINNKSDFYNRLELDVSIIEEINEKKTELPIAILDFLEEEFKICKEYLNVGLGPVFLHTDNHDVLLDEDIHNADDEAVDIQIPENELSNILKEALDLSQQDLKNKGHISDDSATNI